MIRASKEPVAWPVPWKKEQTFLFRAGDVIERGDLEADLDGTCGAAEVFQFDWARAFEEGVTALLPDDPGGAGQLVGIHQAWLSLKKGEKLSAEEQAGLDQARELLKDHWPAYRALVTREARRQQLAPTLAFARYCVGWEGPDLPDFKLGADDRVQLDSLSKLSPLTLRAAGAFAYGLQYGSVHAKNSAALSKSDDSPQTSASDTRPAVGKSTAKGGRKTPSRRSRAGRSQRSTSGSTAGA